MKIMAEETNQQNTEESVNYPYVYGISFKQAMQTYYFGSMENTFSPDDLVVVETIRGVEIGKVKNSIERSKLPKVITSLKPIIRKAGNDDLKKYNDNLAKAANADVLFREAVKEQNLDMSLVSSEYTLDSSKIIFTYIADDRVDFRDLLKILASKLHCRIELRQIGPRDRAKVIGGLGPCGLPMCCSTFLSDFEGVSINMAKNQLLALNTSKISGQCGKLSCCLKYEDSLYSELRKGLPKIGLRVSYKNDIMKITSMNVLTKIMKLENKENTVFITFDEYFKEAKDVPPAKFSKQ